VGDNNFLRAWRNFERNQVLKRRKSPSNFAYLAKCVKIAHNPHGRRDHMPAIVLLGAQWGDEGKTKIKAFLNKKI
jgi:hypothetical protein